MQMRVRSNREKPEPRSRPGGVLRRPHRSPAPAQAEPETETDLTDERRMRESGGPDDRAMYTCSCGYVFEADVTTTVTCPHCGCGQAW